MTDLQGLSILLVEDEKDLKQLFLWDFEGLNANIETAETLNEAKQHVQNIQFDAIISDVKLPDGTGVDLFRFMKAQNIQVPKKYFMTAFTSEELDLTGLKIDHLFKKPLKTRDVIEYIVKDLN